MNINYIFNVNINSKKLFKHYAYLNSVWNVVWTVVIACIYHSIVFTILNSATLIITLKWMNREAQNINMQKQENNDVFDGLFTPKEILTKWMYHQCVHVFWIYVWVLNYISGVHFDAEKVCIIPHITKTGQKSSHNGSYLCLLLPCEVTKTKGGCITFIIDKT